VVEHLPSNRKALTSYPSPKRLFSLDCTGIKNDSNSVKQCLLCVDTGLSGIHINLLNVPNKPEGRHIVQQQSLPSSPCTAEKKGQTDQVEDHSQGKDIIRT
jgi:hypothetical protein